MNFLKKLGIKQKNYGASTGTKWIKTSGHGELKIISPVNGKLVAIGNSDELENEFKAANLEDLFVGLATGESV